MRSAERTITAHLAQMKYQYLVPERCKQNAIFSGTSHQNFTGFQQRHSALQPDENFKIPLQIRQVLTPKFCTNSLSGLKFISPRNEKKQPAVLTEIAMLAEKATYVLPECLDPELWQGPRVVEYTVQQKDTTKVVFVSFSVGESPWGWIWKISVSNIHMFWILNADSIGF